MLKIKALKINYKKGYIFTYNLVSLKCLKISVRKVILKHYDKITKHL